MSHWPKAVAFSDHFMALARERKYAMCKNCGEKISRGRRKNTSRPRPGWSLMWNIMKKIPMVNLYSANGAEYFYRSRIFSFGSLLNIRFQQNSVEHDPNLCTLLSKAQLLVMVLMLWWFCAAMKMRVYSVIFWYQSIQMCEIQIVKTVRIYAINRSCKSIQRALSQMSTWRRRWRPLRAPFETDSDYNCNKISTIYSATGC